jgi:hypothetical protein
MTSKVERDEDKKPIGMSFYEIGKASIECPEFTLSIESKWEMEKSDSGDYVACQFVCHKQILIAQNGDLMRCVPYPRLCTLDSWLTAVEQAKILDQSMEDAEMRANEKDL